MDALAILIGVLDGIPLFLQSLAGIVIYYVMATSFQILIIPIFPKNLTK
jgi:hypothetical protein